MGKTYVIIITNSSKTDARNIERLKDRFGVAQGRHYRSLVSSSQILHDRLGDMQEARVHSVCAPEDEGLASDLAHVKSVPLSEASIVVLLSIPEADRERTLERLARAGIPIWVPSSDIDSVTPSGLTLGLRVWLEDLRQSGAEVQNFGKPSESFYRACDRYWGGAAPARVLAVGDQVTTDVVGAHLIGWEAALVKTGAGARYNQAASDILPDLLLPSFRL